ncbi:hypothetical protein Patl1_27380 [Pistacia atlantica]|uniref:Uncharacterized protein n=1 Tax=Pistacia atlantica TaxID=434234 RepID=A0ACC1BCF9_9ROSI|nr:hypothetical protein Patl1_27380 [Pistacia atlantica]
MVPKDELDMDRSNKISFLNKNPFFDLFHLFHDRNKRRYTLHYDFESEDWIMVQSTFRPNPLIPWMPKVDGIYNGSKG